jgi:endoglucanase Acf2
LLHSNLAIPHPLSDSLFSSTRTIIDYHLMPMAHNIARKAYSAEQLLALRHSASDDTAVQIEAKAQDGAIKGM